MIVNKIHLGKSLYTNALIGGTQELSRNSGSIASGQWADLLTLDSSELAFYGSSENYLIAGYFMLRIRWLVMSGLQEGRWLWTNGTSSVIKLKNVTET